MRNIFTACLLVLFSSVFAFAQNDQNLCPVIQVIEPSELVNPGETMTFSLHSKSAMSELKYLWTVSSGTIIEGQNTPTIRVATTPEMSGALVSASVMIQGLPDNCLNEFSGVASMITLIGCESVDAYGTISRSEEAGRLDVLFSQLTENPDTFALIRILKKSNTSAKQTQKRIRRIIDHANFRKFPKQRVIFIVENSGWERTIIFIFKDIKNMPECENCQLIKGADVR